MTAPVTIKTVMTNLVIALNLVLAMVVSGCQEQVLSNSAPTTERNITPDNSIRHNGNPVSDTPASLGKKNKDTTIVVYYFHRTARCFTCRAIETNAGHVIQEHFSQQITDGRLIWMPVNLDDPAGKEFETVFDISMNTLLVAKMNGAHPTEYKKLEQVWALVNIPEEFSKYVVKEINEYLM